MVFLAETDSQVQQVLPVPLVLLDLLDQLDRLDSTAPLGQQVTKTN
jgi:hypothetical protein